METRQLDQKSCVESQLDRKAWEEGKWRKFEDSLIPRYGDSLAKEITEAMRELYSIYNVDVVKWYANLFDPEIGGCYYSNSGRDYEQTTYNGVTYKLLPDLESTFQGLGIAYTSLIDTKETERIPAWVGERIVKFIKGLQDKESGYFYHPQWGKEATDKFPQRRGRDLQWAVRLLERFGSAPTYDTPMGTKGDGILADGTPADMNGAYRYVPETKEEIEKTKKSVAPQLVDKESFEKYLSENKIGSGKYDNSYTVGSRIAAQGPEILARDKALKAGGADYSLCDILKNWFDGYFNYKTGTWSDCSESEIKYADVNGILKVSAAYNCVERPLPDPVASMRAVLSVITSDADPVHVCSVLNPWFAISNIRTNVEKFTSAKEKEEAKKEIDKIRKELGSHYPALIRATKEKLALFVKPDGSFSYYKNNTAFCSQGMPVAYEAVNEGDLNATNICQFGILGHIFSVLGVETVPVFTEEDRLEYISILEKNAKIL